MTKEDVLKSLKRIEGLEGEIREIFKSMNPQYTMLDDDYDVGHMFEDGCMVIECNELDCGGIWSGYVVKITE